MTTPLQLKRFVLESVDLNTLESYQPAQVESLVETTVSAEHFISQIDESEHQIRLKVRFGSDAENAEADATYAYSGCLVARGFFRVEPDDVQDENEALAYVLLNGSAVLLGMIRTQLAQLTAMGQWGTILLPTVNLYEHLFRDSEETESTE